MPIVMTVTIAKDESEEVGRMPQKGTSTTLILYMLRINTRQQTGTVPNSHFDCPKDANVRCALTGIEITISSSILPLTETTL
jgi:hypothetical protein